MHLLEGQYWLAEEEETENEKKDGAEVELEVLVDVVWQLWPTK